jgi:hypothetical protein
MVNLHGHEAGNGGHGQGLPTARRPLSYSERYATNQELVMKCMIRANQNATHEAAGSDSPDLRMQKKKIPVRVAPGILGLSFR